MKYLRTYEKTLMPKYKEDDYVKLKTIPDYVVKVDISDETNLFAIIKEIKIISRNEPIIRILRFEFYDGNIFYGNEYLIRRKLNNKEIQEFKMKRTAKQYNL
jgi:hypothetical protein